MLSPKIKKEQGQCISSHPFYSMLELEVLTSATSQEKNKRDKD